MRVVEHEELRVEERGEFRPGALVEARADVPQLLARCVLRQVQRGGLAVDAIVRDRETA